MKRKSTSHLGQWWNIAEIHHAHRNSKLISFSRREKVHRTSLNNETFLKLIILSEIQKSSHFHEEKKYIGRHSIMKYCWNSSWWEKLYNNSILMKIKSTSHVAQWWNIFEIHHAQRNSEMTWSWRGEKVHRTLVNDEIFLKFIMITEIQKWLHFHAENKHIRPGQSWKILEIHHPHGNSKIISFSSIEKLHQRSVNDEILFKFILREILR